MRGIVFDESCNTTVSVVCVSSKGERSFLYYPGSSSSFTENDVPDYLIKEADFVFVAGAMLLSAFDGKPCASLMKKAKELGKYTVMDTAWDFDDVWLPKVRMSDLIFMPSIEASKLWRNKTRKIADKLFSYGCRNVITKWGKTELMYVHPGS